ncbi:MAG TPA: hypothetical protein VKA21_15575 [Candidatus Binatia bacterium]|nr:hypothetical protein [Candidatus Binatia bacterium]
MSRSLLGVALACSLACAACGPCGVRIYTHAGPNFSDAQLAAIKFIHVHVQEDIVHDSIIDPGRPFNREENGVYRPSACPTLAKVSVLAYASATAPPIAFADIDQPVWVGRHDEVSVHLWLDQNLKTE